MGCNIKEKPILFKGDMVRAILEGRKTETRRILVNAKGYPKIGEFKKDDTPGYDFIFRDLRPGRFLWNSFRKKDFLLRCPYGQVGDRLWVRETFGYQVRRYGGGTGRHIVYRANNENAIDYTSACGKEFPVKWKPSIHMFRKYSRITLEITEISVERVQGITEEGAKAEGCNHELGRQFDWNYIHDYDSLKKLFALLWDSINKNRGFGWDSNPWVWVVKFKVVKS